MNLHDKKIILVGCGKMGPAMLAGWLVQGVDINNVIAVDPVAEEVFGIIPLRNNEEIPKDFEPDFIVFAVKPDMMENVCQNYKRFKRSNMLYISIAAGKNLSSLAEHISSDAAIVRAMPNLPAVISEGITIAIANEHVDLQQKEDCYSLFEAIGEFRWADDENLMDAVTAISGSGPAYLFYFMECFTEAAKELGLPDDMAELLAKQTIYGSVSLVERSGEPPASLREKVTSPGGTTEAALKILMAENGLKSLISKAANAAKNKAKELS